MLRRSFAALVCSTLLANTAAGEPAALPSFGHAADALPLVNTRDVPLTESIWVAQDSNVTEVPPWTEEYYNLRIAGRWYLTNNELRPLTRLRAEVVQLVDENRVWIQPISPARCEDAGNQYVVPVSSGNSIVVMPSTNGFEPGRKYWFSLSEQQGSYVCTMSGGKSLSIPWHHAVTSVDLNSYLALARAYPKPHTQQAADRIVSIQDQPKVKTAGPIGRSTSVANPDLPSDPAAAQYQSRRLRRSVQDAEDRVERRSKILTDLRQIRDDTDDPQKQAELNRVIRRTEALLSQKRNQLTNASNTLMRIEHKTDK